ncbi:MAG: PBP1A family penicillin-binding protein [Acidobacteria bacterium]|nr:PBP1A family penicillin-binding protein [Acidobacteriota bacterium]
MSVRARQPQRSLASRILFSPAGKVFLALCAVGFTIGFSAFLFFYLKFARLIDEKLTAGPFTNTSMVFAAPRTVTLGEDASPMDVVSLLRRSGYSESRATRMGSYTVKGESVEVYPGPDSFFNGESALMRFREGKISQIISLRDNTERTMFTLEPELITNLFDRNREKRRLVRFQDIPKVLVNAVVSAEDKRFFQHAGFDPLRIIKAAYVDVKTGQRSQGASTLSMQVARMFWLETKKTIQRKASEVLITIELERKLTKEQIFEYYANQVPLGRRGSFEIRGFGEAAMAFFGKDLTQLTVAEAATLAGQVQRPSYTNPYRWPDRAVNRRNIILYMMFENGYLNERDYALAKAAPLTLAKGGVESTDAPYFVDIVNDELQERFQNHDFQTQTYRVYTTLDMNLQREAAEAVRVGLKEVDERLKRRLKGYGTTVPEAQVALVALDAHTGEVKALVGGRNYGASQLNRALAKRQPGSSFKPFVYAAALNTAVSDSANPITIVTHVIDEPTTFWFDGKPYEPRNHYKDFYGPVTLRQALAKSMNIPAVRIAEMAGYSNVVSLARRAGLNMKINPTPSVALGAYEVTPIEIAGGYTIFSNYGTQAQPSFLKSIRDDKGALVFEARPAQKSVLDPRVAYLITNLMEEVLRSGTGAGVRSRGFSLPAAGKTGTSHDGWFAGFTSKLICVVWVGFDDNRELPLDGAASALPVWSEFMKRAHTYREYASATGFSAPDGIVSVEVDSLSGELASPACPNTRGEFFITGSQPQQLCHLHRGGAAVTQVAGWDSPDQEATAPAPRSSGTRRVAQASPPAQPTEPPKAESTRPHSKGLFGKIRDMFK